LLRISFTGTCTVHFVSNVKPLRCAYSRKAFNIACKFQDYLSHLTAPKFRRISARAAAANAPPFAVLQYGTSFLASAEVSVLLREPPLLRSATSGRGSFEAGICYKQKPEIPLFHSAVDVLIFDWLKDNDLID
jgi:hypothetical protein